VRLIPPFLTERNQVADQLRLPLTAPLCQSHLHTQLTTSQRRLQRSRPEGRDTLGSIPLPWSKLYHKLQQHSDKPLNNPSVDGPHPGTDSPRSLSTEIEAAPKHSRPFATGQFESSLEIPETSVAILERMWHEEDDPSNDGNTHPHAHMDAGRPQLTELG
jgi:hypothetical protein